MAVKGGPRARVATTHGWRSGGRTSQARLAGVDVLWEAVERGLSGRLCVWLFMAIIAIDGELATTGPTQASVLAANVL